MSLQDLRDALGKLAKYKEALGEEYSARAYLHAIDIITSQAILKRILDGTSLPRGIGPKIREKIIEYYATGSIAELSVIRTDPKIISLESFEKIIGIGPKTALELVSKGLRTYEDLKGYPDLTELQKVGLKYHDQVMVRIPRDIIESVFRSIKDIIRPTDDDDMILSGSYRRMKETSGDVDILICSDSIQDISSFDIPGSIPMTAGKQKRSFLYPVGTGDRLVQVDMFVSPKKNCPLYLNYSTGSFDHNIALRTKAKKLGYHLTQSSLTRLSDGSEVPVKSEEELYAILGMKYIEPKDRN